MIGIRIIKGSSFFEFGMNQCKLILGDHLEKLFAIQQCLYQFASSSSATEFETENNISLSVQINESEVNKKKMQIFKIGDSFELQDELKMNTKSYLQAYCETLLNDETYYNSINTISILFQSLSQELNLNSDQFSIEFADMNVKQLIKLINVKLLQDDLYSSAYNLSYEDYYLYQLNVLLTIDASLYENQVFCILKLHTLTEKLYTKIKEFKNIRFLIFSVKCICKINIEDIYYIGLRNVVDFGNEDQIYDLFSTKKQTMEEIKNMIKDYFIKLSNGTKNDIVDLIMK